MIVQLLRSIRPRQWVKNVVVLAAVMFSEHLLDAAYVVTALSAAGVFVLLSSAIYLDENLPLDQAMRRMQRRGHRLAIVLNRNRREIGLVSLQDILRAVFGEVSL